MLPLDQDDYCQDKHRRVGKKSVNLMFFFSQRYNQTTFFKDLPKSNVVTLDIFKEIWKSGNWNLKKRGPLAFCCQLFQRDKQERKNCKQISSTYFTVTSFNLRIDFRLCNHRIQYVYIHMCCIVLNTLPPILYMDYGMKDYLPR